MMTEGRRLHIQVINQEKLIEQLQKDHHTSPITNEETAACTVCTQLQEALQLKDQQLRQADILSEQRWQEAATEQRLHRELSDAWDHQKTIADQYCRDKKEKEKLLLDQGAKYEAQLRHVVYSETVMQ